MPEITLQVTQKLPSLTGDVRRIVTDNTDYTARFTFDSGWGEGVKTYFFVLEDGTTYTPVVSADTVISLPRLPAGSSGWLYLGVQQGNMVTTRACAIPVLPSIMAALPDPPVPPPEPDVYAQIIALINQLPNALHAAERAESAADSADESEAGAAASEAAAAISAAAAQAAAMSMTYISFSVDPDGCVYAENSELLGTTSFVLTDAGNMEVII